MGKRIIQQARGHGSFSYRVRRSAYRFKLKYPRKLEGEGIVMELINSSGHSAPLAKIKYNEDVFYIPAFNGMIEGQKIMFNNKEIKDGNILPMKDIPVKAKIYNLESRPGDGGVFIKTAGSYAVVTRIAGDEVFVLMPSKKEKKLNGKCRVIVGSVA